MTPLFNRHYDWRGNLPRIAGKAAVRTGITIAVFLVIMLVAGVAYAATGDTTGAATGTASDVIAATAGSPTLGEVAQDLGHLKVGTNLFFLIVGVALIFFMQAGFMLVETGFCRAKNAAYVAAMNLGIFTVGALAYLLIGFGLQFGGFGAMPWGGASALSGSFEIVKGWGLFGTKGFALSGGAYDVAIAGMFLFQLVFMDTAATIPTGAMAERWKFSSFVIYGIVMSAIIYPVYGMWVWGGGWLAKLGTNVGLGHGVLDFAGSSVVHAVAVSWVSPGSSCWAPASASSPKTARPTRSRAITSRWPSWARSSSSSAGSASTACPRWPPRTCASR